MLQLAAAVSEVRQRRGAARPRQPGCGYDEGGVRARTASQPIRAGGRNGALQPGGPGISAIGQAAKVAGQFAPLLDRRDQLIIDPRGTGRSGALRCHALDAGAAFAPRAAFVAAIGACGRELGSRASQYGSAAVADDFETVRAALRVDCLDLWGASYGTYLIQVYAARHPKHVRSIVLSGAYPIKFDPWGLDRLRAARRAIHLVCACRGDAVLRDVGAVAARLRRHPATFTITAGEHRIPVRLDEAAPSPVQGSRVNTSSVALPMAGPYAPGRTTATT